MGTPVPWTESEDIALFRKLVSNALNHRAEFYADASLAAWSSNGGDKINKKLQQLLKKFEASIPGAGEVVNQEVAKYVRGKRDKDKAKGDGKVVGKKRKMEVKGEDDEDW